MEVEKIIYEILYRLKTIELIDKKMVPNKNNLREICIQKIYEAKTLFNIQDADIDNHSRNRCL
jgi:hypothetical protein